MGSAVEYRDRLLLLTHSVTHTPPHRATHSLHTHCIHIDIPT